MIHNGTAAPVTRRHTRLLILIGLLSYGVFLLANLPAALVWRLVASPSLPVQLANVQGTLWSGSAGKVTINGGGGPVALPALAWTVHLSPGFVLGKLPLTVTLGSSADEMEAHGELALSPGELEITDATIDSHAQWLADAVGSELPGTVSGSVTLKLQQLALSSAGCSHISGRATLNNLQLHSPFGTFTVGDINAPLSCKNQALVATITQSSPEFSSEGTFTMDSRGNYRYQGDARTNSSTPVALTRALSMITRENQGAWPLRFQGRLN